MAVLHSGLTDRERADEYRRIQAGQVDVAIGARSAVFAPFAKLGLIVVDEEHENSYKQDEGLRYHARDVAVMRAKFQNAVARARFGNALRSKAITMPAPASTATSGSQTASTIGPCRRCMIVERATIPKGQELYSTPLLQEIRLSGSKRRSRRCCS